MALPGESDRNRILLITHATELGGAELALIRLAEALPSPPRERLLVACLAEGEMSHALRGRGVDVLITQLPDRTRTLSRNDLLHPLSLARAVVDTSRLVRRLAREASNRAALVQSASMKAHVISVPVALLSRRPLIWYLHDRLAPDYLPRVVAAALRLLSRMPRTVVVNSQATARTVPRDSIVIYPGFEPRQLLPVDLVASRETPDPPVFTMLGRISPTKGQEEFVRAASAVHVAHPTCRFRIVGSAMFGHEVHAEQVRALADQLGAPVEWVGFSDDPSRELDGATALVHASPTPEPFGQVVLEACVRGVPVIATDAGGVPEIVGADGLLVPPGDVDALSAAMVQCLSNPDESRARALRAYLRATDTFTISISAQAMTQVWKKVSGCAVATFSDDAVDRA